MFQVYLHLYMNSRDNEIMYVHFYQWTTSLVVACVSCMHIVLFVGQIHI